MDKDDEEFKSYSQSFEDDQDEDPDHVKLMNFEIPKRLGLKGKHKVQVIK